MKKYFKIVSGYIFVNSGVLPIILFASALRVFFYMGHLFSDDSYYSKAAFDLFNNGDIWFLGYPIVKSRIAMLFSTGGMFELFGISEFSSIIIPFFTSLLTIVLVYKFALLLFHNDKKIAKTSAFLYAIIPTDIIFATINFTDLQASFLLYLSLYLLVNSIKKDKIVVSLLAGFVFTVGVMFKSIILNGLVVLFLFTIFDLFNGRKNMKYYLIYISGFVSIILLEMVVNSFIYGDALRRLHLTEMNYTYSWYAFFPGVLGDAKNYTFINYLTFLAENLKYLFLRRFYLFLPLLALLFGVLNMIVKQNKILTGWYLSLLFVFLFFTTSLTGYRPLTFEPSWYLFPVFIPAVLLVGEFLGRMNRKIITTTLIIFVLFSFYMSTEYQGYFDIKNKNEFKEYVANIEGKSIFTDHHTKYGIDLIRQYRDYKNVKLVTLLGLYGKSGDIVVFSEKKVDELKLQGYSYSIDAIKDSLLFVDTIGEFEIYEVR